MRPTHVVQSSKEDNKRYIYMNAPAKFNSEILGFETDFVENVTFFQNAIARSLGGAESCASDMLQVGVAFLVFEICCMLP